MLVLLLLLFVWFLLLLLLLLMVLLLILLLFPVGVFVSTVAIIAAVSDGTNIDGIVPATVANIAVVAYVTAFGSAGYGGGTAAAECCCCYHCCCW